MFIGNCFVLYVSMCIYKWSIKEYTYLPTKQLGVILSMYKLN